MSADRYERASPFWVDWSQVCVDLTGRVDGMQIVCDPHLLAEAEKERRKYARRKARKSAIRGKRNGAQQKTLGGVSCTSSIAKEVLMSKQIKVIIKRPGERVGHIAHIDNSLANLQGFVEGHIETVTCGPAVIICNEESKLLNLQHNFIIGTTYKDIICGTAIVCGRSEDDFADIPFDKETWRRLLVGWGNMV